MMLQSVRFAFWLLCTIGCLDLWPTAAQSATPVPKQPVFSSSEQLHALLQQAVESGTGLVLDPQVGEVDELDGAAAAVKRGIYRRFGTWERLQQAALLQDWFSAADEHGVPTKERESRSSDIRQPALPVLVEAPELEIESIARGARSWDTQDAVLGHQRNIFEFWDDPICDVFLFPSGLRVCGDARIRGNLVVLSGMNLTEALDRDVGASAPRSPHIRRRCTLDEADLRARAITARTASESYVSSRRQRPRQLDDIAPPPTNETAAPSDAGPALSRNWCFLKLVVRSADVYVLGSAEFGGSLYLRSARVDTGASLLVGLRGLLYSSERLTGLALSRNAQDLADERQATDQEEGPSSTEEDRSNTGPPTPREMYRSLASTTGRSRVSLTFGEAASGMNSGSSRVQQLLRERRAEQLYLGRREMEMLRCPLLDLRGAAQFIVRRNNGALQVVGNNEHLLRELRRYMNDEDSPAGATASYLANGGRSFGGITDVDNFAPVYRQQPFFNSSRFSSVQSPGPVGPARPFGDLLAPLDYNATWGDLVALSLVTVDNAAAAWVFGNVVAEGIVVDAGSQFHTFCGQAYLNVSSGAGFTLLDAAVVSLGGYLDSVAPRLVLQQGAAIAIFGSATVTHFVQLLKSAVAEVFGPLISFVTSVAVGSELVAHGPLKAELLLDISDGSVVRSNGTVELGSLQLENRSTMRCLLRNMAALYGSTGQIDSLSRRSARRSSDPQPAEKTPPSNNQGERRTTPNIPAATPSITEVSRHVVVIRNSLVLNGASDVIIDEASLLGGEEIHLANHSRLLLQKGDVFLRNPGLIRVVGSTLQVGGSLLAPEGSVLVGFGSDVGIVGTLRCGGITLRQAEKALARPLRRKDTTNSAAPAPGATLQHQNVLTLSPIDGRIAAAPTHKETGWAKRFNHAGGPARRGPGRVLSQSSDRGNAASPLQNGSNFPSEASRTRGNSTSSGRRYNTTGSEGSNKENRENKGHHDNSNNEEDELEDLSLIDPALLPRPALLVESSRLTIGGDIEAINSWLDFTRLSSVVVGGSIVGLAVNSTLLRLRERSACKVLGGPVGGGMLVSLNDRSVLTVPNGSLVIDGDLEVTGRSMLKAHAVQALGNIWISQASSVVVANEVELSGEILAVSGWSTLQCHNVRQRKGDFFVEDGGSALIAGGSVWVYGSLVAQDRASVRAVEGHIVVIQGDIVAENYSHLSASKAILLYGAYRRNQLFQRLSPVLRSAGEDAVAIDSNAVPPPAAGNSTANIHNATLGVLEPDHFSNPFLVASTIRRTLESTVSSSLFIPQTLEVQVYFQALPDIFLRRVDSKRRTGPAVSAELNQAAAAAATSVERPSTIARSKPLTESVKPQQANFAVPATRISHGFNSNLTQAKLAGQQAVIQELNNPRRWDSLVVSRGTALMPSSGAPAVPDHPGVPGEAHSRGKQASQTAHSPSWPGLPGGSGTNAATGPQNTGVASDLLKMAATASAGLQGTPPRDTPASVSRDTI